MPILRIFCATLDALGQLAVRSVAHRHHDQALVLVDRPLARVDQHAHPVGLQAVGDPHLLAGDHIVVTVLARHAFDARHVAARRRLAHADAAHHVTGNGRYQKLPAQLVAAKARQRRGAHVGLHTDGHRHATTFDVAQRLGHRHGIGIVEAGASEGLRLGEAQQAQVAELLEHLMGGKDFGGFPFIDVGVDLGVDEALEGLLDLEVFVRVVHLLVLKGRACARWPRVRPRG
jgi:hypothetical protein